MKTTVDWLKFRTTKSPFETLAAVAPAFGTTADLLALGEPCKGRDGWLHRRAVLLAGEQTLAQIDYGGESQRGWARFDMSGAGCEWVQDWQTMATALQGIGAELRRVDLALTIHDGSVTHDRVVQAHANGMFSSGGRNPKSRIITGSDPRDGRTFYAGSRDGAKYVRCYEKGFELLSKLGMPENLKQTTTPFTMLTDRDSYFAGANPFCASLLPSAPERKVMGLPDFNAKAALAVQIEHCRRAYGKIIRAAIMAHGEEEALRMISANEPSRRLVEAGALTIAYQ